MILLSYVNHKPIQHKTIQNSNYLITTTNQADNSRNYLANLSSRVP